MSGPLDELNLSSTQMKDCIIELVEQAAESGRQATIDALKRSGTTYAQAAEVGRAATVSFFKPTEAP